MARIDHVAVESTDPGRAAAFYERFLGVTDHAQAAQ
jgi:hypothetical protein